VKARFAFVTWSSILFSEKNIVDYLVVVFIVNCWVIPFWFNQITINETLHALSRGECLTVKDKALIVSFTPSLFETSS
jgi:hypothetical protein